MVLQGVWAGIERELNAMAISAVDERQPWLFERRWLAILDDFRNYLVGAA
jgi:hypothetical protein